MKKLIMTIAAIALAAGMSFAQDMSEITEIAKQGQEAFQNGDKAEALNLFNKALELAGQAGDAGLEIVEQCKTAIPIISLSLAKEVYNEKNFAEAADKFKEVAALAEKYESYDVADEALALIPKAHMAAANTLFNAKEYAAAVEAYKVCLEDTPDNGTLYLNLGAALNAMGNTEEAVDAFKQAAGFGQEKAANKRISTIYLKKASQCLKEKKYADAVENAEKVLEIGENAQAYQIAGQASQIAGKNGTAIKYFEKYLEVAPDAKNAGQIAYTVGALYQTANNIAKAKEYYQKATGDPKFGAEAQKMLNALR